MTRVAGKDTVVQVRGYSGSTQVPSLLEAFEGLEISTTLPGLKEALLKAAALKGMGASLAASILLSIHYS